MYYVCVGNTVCNKYTTRNVTATVLRAQIALHVCT